jgi:hypothetical protein
MGKRSASARAETEGSEIIKGRIEGILTVSVIPDAGAEGGTRTPTSYLTRPSNVRVYQFRHFGFF